MLINNGLAARPGSVYFSVSSPLWNVYLLFKEILFGTYLSAFVGAYFTAASITCFFQFHRTTIQAAMSYNITYYIFPFISSRPLTTLIRVLHTSIRTPQWSPLVLPSRIFLCSSLSTGASGIHKPASVYVTYLCVASVCESRGVCMCVCMAWRSVYSCCGFVEPCRYRLF